MGEFSPHWDEDMVDESSLNLVRPFFISESPYLFGEWAHLTLFVPSFLGFEVWTSHITLG